MKYTHKNDTKPQCENCAYFCYRWGVYECDKLKKFLWIEDSLFEKWRRKRLSKQECPFFIKMKYFVSGKESLIGYEL